MVPPLRSIVLLASAWAPVRPLHGRPARALSALLLALCCAGPAHAAHILVDAGHGPEHPGATGASGRAEYLYNRDLAATLARALAALGDRTTRIEGIGADIPPARRTEAGTTSLTAASCSSSRPWAILSRARPTRPKPLMPKRRGMAFLSFDRRKCR